MIVVVSDLHLSEGRREQTRKLSPAEDFFFDEAFARFLSYLNTTGSNDQVHLVINGDFFDFLQVSISAADIDCCEHLANLSPKERAYICGYGAKTDEQSTILKLEKIARGHRVFFRALGEFVVAGHRLTVVIGNHDIELFWPGVRDRFRALLGVEELMTASADGGRPEANIEFASGFFYDPDYELYAEHGHQYDALNSFRYPLHPVLPLKTKEVNLPVGSLFVRYLLNQIERINPFADNIKPNTKYVALALKNNPWAFRRLLWLLWRFIVTLAKSYRRSGHLSQYRASDLVDFKEETDKRIAETSSQFRIAGDPHSPGHPLHRVLALHKLPINDSKGRFAWRSFLSYLDVWFFLLGGAAAATFIVSVMAQGIANVLSAISLGITIIGVVAGNLFFSVEPAMSRENRRAANEIGRIFNDSKNPLRYVTFGHTHKPDILTTDNGTLYFNTGTWGVIFNDEEQLIREKEQFALLLISNPGDEPQLLRWNDAVGIPEPLPLFDFA